MQDKFNIANGYKHDATIIYGDTDSVMVRFGNSDLKEAMDLGEERLFQTSVRSAFVCAEWLTGRA